MKRQRKKNNRKEEKQKDTPSVPALSILIVFSAAFAWPTHYFHSNPFQRTVESKCTCVFCIDAYFVLFMLIFCLLPCEVLLHVASFTLAIGAAWYICRQMRVCVCVCLHLYFMSSLFLLATLSPILNPNIMNNIGLHVVFYIWVLYWVQVFVMPPMNFCLSLFGSWCVHVKSSKYSVSDSIGWAKLFGS